MFPSIPPSRRRRICPSVNRLVERTLLNATLPHLDRGPSVAANVFAAKRKHPAPTPIVPSLPATPTASYTTVPASGELNPYGLAVVPAGLER